MIIKTVARLTLILLALVAVIPLLASCQTNMVAVTPDETPPYTSPITLEPQTPTTGATAAEGFYIYPAQPGTPEWRKFTSLDEMIAACQVPEVTLKKMSTKALVLTVVYYPLWGMIIFHNDYKQGFAEFAAGANCVQELYTRADAATELLVLYHQMTLDVAGMDEDDYQKLQYPTKFLVMDLLLSEKPIREKVTDEQRESLDQGIIPTPK
jgi:hypothetical protein